MDCSLPGSSVHGIFQARTLEWVAISSPGDLPDPGIKLASPALAGGFFTTEPLHVKLSEAEYGPGIFFYYFLPFALFVFNLLLLY